MPVISQFGAGRIGEIHAANIAASARATLKHVVDVRAEAAKDLASRHGATAATPADVWADETVDAVVIASSTDTHADLIIEAARAGKAIFCEKPIDLSLDRVDQAIDAVDTAGVLALVGFNRRFDPSIGGLGRAVRAGEIGALESVIITSRDPGPPPIDYIKVSGGLFRDMMIHDFDIAHWLLGGVPAEVFARGACRVDPAIGKAGDIDTAAVTLVAADGTVAHITNSRRAVYGYDQRVEAFGAEGMLRAGNRTETTLSHWTGAGVTGSVPQNFFLERYAEAYRIELDHFLDCLEGKAQPLTTMRDGRVALQLADAAEASMKSGQPVAISG